LSGLNRHKKSEKNGEKGKDRGGGLQGDQGKKKCRSQFLEMGG